MTKTEFYQLHGELGACFSLYAAEHLDSPLLDPLTDAGEPELVFLSDDTDFNTWALREMAERRRHDDVPNRPVVLYHVAVPRPPTVDSDDWTKARF
jgi:hypothetical protein